MKNIHGEAEQQQSVCFLRFRIQRYIIDLNILHFHACTSYTYSQMLLLTYLSTNALRRKICESVPDRV